MNKWKYTTVDILRKQAHCILDLPNDKYRMEIEKEVK